MPEEIPCPPFEVHNLDAKPVVGMAWQTTVDGKERGQQIMEAAALHQFTHRYPNTGDINLSWHFEKGARHDEDGQEYTIPDRWLLLAEAEELS